MRQAIKGCVLAMRQRGDPSLKISDGKKSNQDPCATILQGAIYLILAEKEIWGHPKKVVQGAF